MPRQGPRRETDATRGAPGVDYACAFCDDHPTHVVLCPLCGARFACVGHLQQLQHSESLRGHDLGRGAHAFTLVPRTRPDGR